MRKLKFNDIYKMVMEDIGNYSGQSNTMRIVNDLRNSQNKGMDTSKLAYATSSQRMNPKFADMMGDPSKRPQFGDQKANELEQKYEQGMAQIKEKYKDVQRPDYGELIENRYRYTQNKSLYTLYAMTDSLRTGDKHAWDKMVSGDTSRGIYTDVAEVGHHDISYERTASETIRRLLGMADAYYSGDVKQLSHLLGLTPDDNF